MAAPSLVLVFGGPPLRVLGELGEGDALELAAELRLSKNRQIGPPPLNALNLADKIAPALAEAKRAGWGRIVLDTDDLDALHELCLVASSSVQDRRFETLYSEVVKAVGR